jgi:hypothetical protein
MHWRLRGGCDREERKACTGKARERHAALAVTAADCHRVFFSTGLI